MLLLTNQERATEMYLELGFLGQVEVHTLSLQRKFGSDLDSNSP